MQFFSDYMDEACKFQVGHNNWELYGDNEKIRELEELHGERIKDVIIIFKEDNREEDDKL